MMKWPRSGATGMGKSESKIAKPLSQVGLTFAVIGLTLALLTGARFFGFLIAAICSIAPLVFGPRKYRKWGLAFFVIGAAAAGATYTDYRSDPYFVRVRVGQVYNAAVEYRTAAENYRIRNGSWPADVEALESTGDSYLIGSVSIAADGTIKVVPAFSPVKGTTILLTPRQFDDGFAWTCRSPDMPRMYLPADCRDEQAPAE
jgi:hypothetical protein